MRRVNPDVWDAFPRSESGIFDLNLNKIEHFSKVSLFGLMRVQTKSTTYKKVGCVNKGCKGDGSWIITYYEPQPLLMTAARIHLKLCGLSAKCNIKICIL
jgi:hypothetical protein